MPKWKPFRISPRLTNKSDKNLADFEDEMEDEDGMEGYQSWRRQKAEEEEFLNFQAAAAAAGSAGGSFGGVMSMLQQQQIASFCHQRQHQQNRLTARQQVQYFATFHVVFVGSQWWYKKLNSSEAEV